LSAWWSGKKIKRLADGSIANYDELLEPYASAIGKLLHDWNSLQTEFMLLFTDIGPWNRKPQNFGQIWAAWNAIPVDRLQRAMIREIAREKYGPSPHREKRNKRDSLLWKEIEWVLERADSLGRKRDDAAHVPLMMHVLGEDRALFMPERVTRHPIAIRLQWANVIEEFALYREQASVLTQFVYALREHLQGGRRGALPKRPQWPTQRPKAGHKSSRRQARPKARSPLPRSSRG
jgi:hypothetical protein